MGSYKIFWKKSALKDLDDIDPRYIPKIIEHIGLLSENPSHADVKKITCFICYLALQFDPQLLRCRYVHRW
ncbi:MAG: hypothetical protein J7L07_06155 [Candidatus Odinarchaeota archaeon]|nr:hypothetical protein [Candidatus Odinarchaeota archaeon]